MNSSELREKLIKICDEAEYSIDWVSPEWKPITKVKPENRRFFMFVLARVLGLVTDEPGLGVTTVKWSGCDPEREFLVGPHKLVKEIMYDPDALVNE